MKEKINTLFLIAVGIIMISFDEISQAIQEASNSLDEGRKKIINRTTETKA
jgi:hypothetical protein